MALITPAQFKEHYPQLSGTGADALLTTLIARANDLLAAYCGYRLPDGALAHTLEVARYTLRIDGPVPGMPRVLCLDLRPINDLVSVHVDSTWAFGGGTEVTSQVEDDEDLRRTGMLWLLPSSSTEWESSHRSNKVVVDAGYATTPPGLVALAAQATRHLWDLRQTQGEESFGYGGDAATRVDADKHLPQLVKDGLRAGRYILPCALAEIEAAEAEESA